MKHPIQAKSKTDNATRQQNSAGTNAASIAPPSYGMDFLDSQAKQPNRTGLPDNLKYGIENLSGLSMDSVRVNYNSAKPTQLNALAYTQGTDIHVAPGQEQHLPHEAWHVVQQAQGRVKPTMQLKGMMSVNDDNSLEKEADVMGSKANSIGSAKNTNVLRSDVNSVKTDTAVVQYYKVLDNKKIFSVEPDKRPKLGYPYAVASGRNLISQTHRKNVRGKHNFLDAKDSKTAWKKSTSDNFSLRISDDNQMAVEDSDLTKRQSKLFFATQAVVNVSNDALRDVGSSFTLRRDTGKTVKILTNKTSDVTLYKVTPRFNGGTADNAPQNCNAMAAKVMGVSSVDSDGMDKAFKTAKLLAPKAAAKHDQEFKKAEQEFATKFNAWETYDKNVPELTNKIAKEYVNNRNSKKAKKLGVNRYATPDVGESYMIASLGSGQKLANGKSRVRDYQSGEDRELGWPYHFGGVVARSGSDTITLENYARGDNRQDQPDPRWYFQMYGTGKHQSFHSFHKAKKEYANPVTITLSKP